MDRNPGCKSDKCGEKTGKTDDTNISFIVNVGNHFVSVIITAVSILYIDSFAGRLSTPQLATLFSRVKKRETKSRSGVLNRTFFRNKRQIQSIESTHCGLYAILFCVWYLKHPSDRMKLRFSQSDLNQNDAMCVKYLKKLVGDIELSVR